MGGILSERAGVFAVGLEGMMLMGAFGGVVGAWASGSALVGVALAIVCGAAIGLVVAIVTVALSSGQHGHGPHREYSGGRADQLPDARALRRRSPHRHPSDAASGLADSRALPTFPVVGPLLFALPPLTYLAIVGCVALAFFLGRTQAGLTLRATGESPETVFASGAEPFRVRMLAVVACGAVAGIGGAVLSLQQVGTFTDGMTGGRGYLALASLIVARWNPFGAAIACLAFGAAEAFELRMQGFGLPVSSYIVQMAPYLIALARARGARARVSDAGRDRTAASAGPMR